MTWSIIARDVSTGEIGIAMASRFFALGARVPFVAPDAGAVASQALLNPLYGPRALDLLRQGHPPTDVIAALIASDVGHDHRQVHLMDREGRVAAHTGNACVDWCGHVVGRLCSVAGNMLAGAAVVERTAQVFDARDDLPFARRLIVAMQAGEAEGGDKRGRQSAALVIYRDDAYSELDLRADDHPDPLAELARLEAVSRERWVHFRRFLAGHNDPAGITDRARIDREISEAIAAAQAQNP